MTETKRIRWTKEDDGGTAGRAGTLDEPLFFIYPPESPGKAHILTAMLPGHTRDFYPSGFVSDLKAKAEEWLTEFVSSLGAVFPAEPDDDLFSDDEDGEPLEVKYASGRRVRYIHPDAGYPGEKEHAAASLTFGEVYTIGWAGIGQSKTDLNLYRDGAPMGRFNSVFFELADHEEAAPAAAGTDVTDA